MSTRAIPGEAVVFGGFEVVAGVGSSASVGGVAFDDGAVYFVHEVLDEGGGEVVVVAGFSGGEFYGYASSCPGVRVLRIS